MSTASMPARTSPICFGGSGAWSRPGASQLPHIRLVSDPDGNGWLPQEITTRLPGRIDSAATSFNSASDLARALPRAEAAPGEHRKAHRSARRELAGLVRRVYGSRAVGQRTGAMTAKLAAADPNHSQPCHPYRILNRRIALSIAQSMLAEFETQAAVTRKFLERLPNDKLNWKPHEKSMSAGQLAYHLASVPGGVVRFVQSNPAQAPGFGLPQPASRQEVLDAFEESITAVRNVLPTFDDGAMNETWRLLVDGQ